MKILLTILERIFIKEIHRNYVNPEEYIFQCPFEDMPLYINDSNNIIRTIAIERLRMGT